MKDGEHSHVQGDLEGKHNHRKLAGIILLAVILAFVAYGVAQTALDTANINNIFSIVVNNTDLYPSQRTVNAVYYANDSPIAVYIIFHALGTGAAQTFDSNFSINSSVVLDRDFKTSAGSGIHDHWSFYTIVPKGSNYSVTNSTNVFSIEWREYPILSGRNGTLSVNQTYIINQTLFNVTYDQTTTSFNSNYSAQTFPNITIVYNQENISKLQTNDTYFNGTIFPQSTNFRNDTINDTIIRNYTAHIKVGTFTRDTTLASGNQAITGVGFKPSYIQFTANQISTQEASFIGFDDGVSTEALYDSTPTGAGTYETTTAYSMLLYQSAGNYYAGKISSFDANGFTVAWTRNGAPSGTATIIYTAFR